MKLLLNKYKKIKKNLEEQLSECKKYNERVQNLPEKLNYRKDDLSSEINNCKINLDKANKKIIALEAQRVVRYKDMQNAEMEINKLNNKLFEYSDNLKKLESRPSDNYEKIQELNSKIIESEQKLVELERKGNVSRREFKMINESLIITKQSNERLKKDIENKNRVLREINIELDECKKRGDVNNDSIAVYINSLKNEKERVEKLTEKILEYQRNLNKISEDKDELSNKLNRLNLSSWLRCLDTEENAKSCMNELLKKYPSAYPLPLGVEQSLVKPSSSRIEGLVMNTKGDKIVGVVKNGELLQVSPPLQPPLPLPRSFIQPPLPPVVETSNPFELEQEVKKSKSLDTNSRTSLLEAIQRKPGLKVIKSCVGGLVWDPKLKQCVKVLARQGDLLSEIKGGKKLKPVDSSQGSQKSQESKETIFNIAMLERRKHIEGEESSSSDEDSSDEDWN